MIHSCKFFHWKFKCTCSRFNTGYRNQVLSLQDANHPGMAWSPRILQELGFVKRDLIYRRLVGLGAVPLQKFVKSYRTSTKLRYSIFNWQILLVSPPPRIFNASTEFKSHAPPMAPETPWFYKVNCRIFQKWLV